MVGQERSCLAAGNNGQHQDARDSLSHSLFSDNELLGRDGKIVSLGQTRKKQASLRGQELIKSLDELLPP